MSGSNLPPSVAGEFRSLKQRVTNLERVLRGLENAGAFDTTFVLSSDVCPTYRPAGDRIYREVLVDLDEPASGELEATLLMNGVAAVTVTIPDGSTTGRRICSVVVGQDDTMTADLPATGTLNARWRPRA